MARIDTHTHALQVSDANLISLLEADVQKLAPHEEADINTQK